MILPLQFWHYNKMKKFFERFIVLSTSFLLVLFAVMLIAIPDREFSDKENRALQEMPKFSVKKLTTGEYTSKIGKYLSDQFPFRDAFVGIKAYAELAQGKRENNGVIYGKGGVLIPNGKIENNRLGKNLEIIKDFANSIGKSVTVAPLPRNIDVMAECVPKSYPKEDINLIWQEFQDGWTGLGGTPIMLNQVLKGDDTYYRTDHHYTTRGAYITYCALGEQLGYRPKEEDYFSLETVAKDFCGTSMRTSGFYLAKKDEIALYRYENDTQYRVTADNQSISLYDFEKLNGVDKYAVFLGGNHARVDISSGEGERQKLLVIRDSFADSLVPFLAIHYDITLVDLRYYTDSVRQLVSQENIDKVLVLENISELSTAKNISILAME